MHKFGLSFDVVPLDEGNPVWKVSDPVWPRVGRNRKECGLECEGDCKRFREDAHLQYRGGLSLAEVREGKRPATPPSAVSGSAYSTEVSNSFHVIPASGNSQALIIQMWETTTSCGL
jgi:hypothetical protein